VLAHERKAMRRHVEEQLGQVRAECEVQLQELRRELAETRSELAVSGTALARRAPTGLRNSNRQH